MENTKDIRSYKPEILTCPFCKGKLSYKHTVSNKVIQFYDGKHIRVKNLGYGCQKETCTNKDHVYFSQTASKMCIKGYTYSSKVIATIYGYKQKHYSREKICDLLADNNIEISARNIDNIYNKMKKQINTDYEQIINSSYEKMMNEFNEIRISIDFISVFDNSMISIRDSFFNEQIGLYFFKKTETELIEKTIKRYIDNKNITYITTVRNIMPSYQYIKKHVNENTKIIAFIKD